MQSALAALMMHGYRPDTNRPGHHMTLSRLCRSPLVSRLSESSCWTRYGGYAT